MKSRPPPEPQFGVGIDFGTTNSVVAIANPARPFPRARALVNRDDGLPHPSVLWFKLDEEPKVGRIAKDNLLGFSETRGNQFITSVKRSLGKNQQFSVFGTKRTGSDVSAEIFKFLKQDAATQSVEIDKAVVTIPVKFDGHTRRELRKAAEQAGIYIKTFIHEPFAAIVGYCYSQKGGRTLDQRNGENILVFDWGGGTLDVTVGQIREGSIVELAADGCSDRSGDFFDECLAGHVKTEFSKRQSIPAEQMSLLPSTKDRLRANCEKCKIDLSALDTHRIMLADFLRVDHKSHSLDQSVSRTELESLIQQDVSDAVRLVDKVLDQAGLRDSDIDLAILIGGTSRIPMVRKELYDRFSTKLVQVENADTIIAEGASIADALGLYPVLARSLFIELSDGSQFPVFQAGDLAKPETCHRNVELFCTDNRDGQARLVIKEQSGIHGQKSETKCVLSIPVSPDLPKPYNNERVIVRFALDSDLVLRISGKGAILPQGSQTEIYDLCFALKSFGGIDEI